jgi:nitrite reductase/ring-hydroxylating ferredoxin subunit
LHGWRFDLADQGKCLNADGRNLVVRRGSAVN